MGRGGGGGVTWILGGFVRVQMKSTYVRMYRYNVRRGAPVPCGSVSWVIMSLFSESSLPIEGYRHFDEVLGCPRAC